MVSEVELYRGLMAIVSQRPVSDSTVVAELFDRELVWGDTDSPFLTGAGRQLLADPPPGEGDALAARLQLRRVVASGSEQRTASGVRVMVSAVELWAADTVVRWTIIGAGFGLDEPSPLTGTAGLADDVGSYYEPMGSGGGGDVFGTMLFSRFVGAVPDTANELVFTPFTASGGSPPAPAGAHAIDPIRVGVPRPD